MKKWLSYIILLLCIPAVLLLGNTVFHNRQYAFISFAVALLACASVFLTFERKRQSSTRLVLLAVLTALSVLGRILFVMTPSFKPVTAMVILAGMYFGGESGFLVGALTAVISNFYFGQGAWTPFQMFSWGFVGLMAGWMAEPLKKNPWLLYGFAAVAGVVFSFLMDIYTVLSADNSFNLGRYLAALASAAPVTVTYAVSNVIFLLILAKPIGRMLRRVKEKYGI